MNNLQHFINERNDLDLDLENEQNLNEAELSPLQKEYREFFKDLLAEFDVTSPAKLTPEKKIEFFNKIKSGWVVGKGRKKVNESIELNEAGNDKTWLKKSLKGLSDVIDILAKGAKHSKDKEYHELFDLAMSKVIEAEDILNDKLNESDELNEGKYVAYFTTPSSPDKEDAEGWVIVGKNEEDAYNKFKKKHKGKTYYGWEIKELTKGDKYFDKDDYTKIQ